MLARVRINQFVDIRKAQAQALAGGLNRWKLTYIDPDQDVPIKNRFPLETPAGKCPTCETCLQQWWKGLSSCDSAAV